MILISALVIRFLIFPSVRVVAITGIRRGEGGGGDALALKSIRHAAQWAREEPKCAKTKFG